MDPSSFVRQISDEKSENPMSDKNKHDMRQYMHGGVNVSGQKFSVGFVFRVVNTTAIYQSSDDTMDFENSPGHGDVVNVKHGSSSDMQRATPLLPPPDASMRSPI